MYVRLSIKSTYGVCILLYVLLIASQELAEYFYISLHHHEPFPFLLVENNTIQKQENSLRICFWKDLGRRRKRIDI